MKKISMRFSVEIVLCLALVVAHPLFAQETTPQPAAEAQPAQQLQPSTVPAAAEPSAPPAASAPQTAVKISPANDAARYLAGLPVAPGSPLTPLCQDPRWGAHARAMNVAFAQLEQRQLNNIRTFRAENIT